MQDGATAHTARVSMKWLEDNFGDRVISKNAAFPWAPYSPDLNPLDFFLWGYLKSRVFRHNPQTVEDLKTAVQNEARGIDAPLCNRVIAHFKRRPEACIAHNGQHIEHLM